MNPNNKTARQKFKTLFADKRPYPKRLLFSLSAMLAFAFTFIFFGPLEIVAFSGTMLNYNYKQILIPMLIISAIVIVAGALLIALLRGRIFNYVLTFISATTICGYVQAALFNGELGSLAGEAIDWADHKPELLINIGVWMLIFIAFYTLLYFSRKIWKKAIVIVSLLLVVMQLAPTIGILAGAYDDVETSELNEYILSTDGMYEYSKKDNIFVFVLDYMDYDYIEAIKRREPSFFNKLDGFTEYTDALSMFGRTKPALNNMFTGSTELPYNQKEQKFLTESWFEDGNDFMKDLKDKSYDITLYTSIKNLFGSPEYPLEYVSNTYFNEAKFNYSLLVKKMLFLSTYRYSPIAIKPFFWSDTNFYNDGVFEKIGNKEVYSTDDAKYIAEFVNATVTKQDENCFKLYHFYGSHPPHSLGIDGTVSSTPSDANIQTMGCFNLLFKAFDKMKELGIYDDATIIITADHGNAGKMSHAELDPMRIGLFYKPSGSTGTPLVQSNAPVSSANFAATVMKAAGADYKKYGIPFDEVTKENQPERFFFKTNLSSENWADLSIEKYSIKGPSRDMKNWKLLATYPVKNSFYGN